MDLKLEPLSQPATLNADKQPAASSISTCPKCKYQRRAADTAPAWQCPGCGVAYAKVAPTPATASSGSQRRASQRMDEDDDTPVVAERSPLGNARLVVGMLLLAMVVGVGWSWVAKRNAKKLQAEQAIAAERQQAIDQASGQLLTDKRLTEATQLFQTGRYEKALVALKPLMDEGNAQAMMLTGVMLTWGHSGAPKEPEQGQQWLQKAANAGSTMAWVWQGYFAELQGKNTGQMDAAVSYYSRAAQAGNGAGLYSMGRLVSTGLGVAKDPARAYSLYALAAKAFDRDVRASELAPRDSTGLGSAAAMMGLKSQLSPVDIVRSEELAKTWQPGNPLP
ncbi:MAG: hypothetical protein CFE43_08190 [Burkholderiales bacterium PBB3]|nr:MAG: hypothetical protein CFE43_08190 [Burkholderiales bacterium PBB3]